MPISLGSLASSIRKKFIDNFSIRSNTSGGLGIASDGSYWNSINGTINVDSGVAKATTTPSSGGAGTTYPMATVNMPTPNNIISLTDINPGSAGAIWVQSSSDWWIVGVDETFNTIPGNTTYAYAYNVGNANYSVGNNAGNYFYSAYTYYTIAFGNQLIQNAGFYVNAVGISNYNSSSNYTSTYAYNRYLYSSNALFGYNVSYNASTSYGANYYPYTYQNAEGNFAYQNYSYAQPLTYTANPSNSTSYIYVSGNNSNQYNFASGTNATTYAYSQILRISRSIASTVNNSIATTILTTNSIAKAVALKIFTSDNVITAKAYSDNNFVTQVGSDLIYTATGATITTQYGIAISPSAYSQSAIIGTSVNITRQ